MGLFQKFLKREQIITKYKIGARVPANKTANKIAENAIRDIKNARRKWL
jgi:hypothetical protein